MMQKEEERERALKKMKDIYKNYTPPSEKQYKNYRYSRRTREGKGKECLFK